MARLSLVIYGEPVAQGRPRFSTAGGQARAYDPIKSREYKQYLRLAATAQLAGKEPLQGPVVLSLRVFRPIPKSLSKKKTALAEAGQLLPVTKPDLDNYVKGVKDALKGICWLDDGQVVGYAEPFGKYYSAKPRVEVEVWEWEV